MTWKTEIKKNENLLNYLLGLEEKVINLRDSIDMLHRGNFGRPFYMAEEIKDKFDDILYNIKQEKDSIKRE